MSRMVHNNKCTGGNAFDEVDGKTYCLGQTDPYYEDVVFVPDCKKCPRLLKNNEDKIDEYCKKLVSQRNQCLVKDLVNMKEGE